MSTHLRFAENTTPLTECEDALTERRIYQYRRGPGKKHNIIVKVTTLIVRDTTLIVSITTLIVRDTTLSVSVTTLIVRDTTLIVSVTTLIVRDTTLIVSVGIKLFRNYSEYS